jgi:hypothetical protein
MQDAQSGSPLALPEGAWGNRWFLPRASIWQRAIALVLMLEGALGALVPIGVLLILPQSDVVLWISVPSGIAFLVLGVAVYRSSLPSIRKCLAAVFLLSAATRIVGLCLYGGPRWEAWWVSLTLAIALGTVSAGVWWAREWGRWSCVILGVALWAEHLTASAYGMLSSMRYGLRESPSEMAISWSVGVAITAIPLVALMVYGVLPSTRNHFAEARDAIARARAVPG